ncbi:MAG: DUF4381 domain-containing protein [Phycisphaerales bacterium]|nr:MAG: DUF4381 domain-containing protein [Phycisphaerales bacterium]
MNGTQYSLDNLRDIVVPDAPPYWPPAPGVWLLLGVLTAVVLALGGCFYMTWRRNAYRRAGLALLDTARTVHDVSVVLKRVALAVFPREEVASLYGDDWIAFLNRTCSRSRFSAIGAIDSGGPATQELTDRAGTWIRHHRFPECRALGGEG